MPRILRISGTTLFIVGAVDPLEGSLAIAIGAGMLVASAYLDRDERHRRLWTWVFALVAIGVAAMWVLSAFGGIGGDSGHSVWWILTLVPYPVGWLLGIGALIARGIRWLRQRAGDAE